MKKLLFVLAFAFFGQQAFSQMYIVAIFDEIVGNCSSSEYTLTKVNPAGVQTHTCIPKDIADGALIILNQELNSVVNLGYKLFETSYESGRLINTDPSLMLNSIQDGSCFIFAIPWTSSGLEEVATTLKSFIISPNPANTFIDISLDYSLKGESEVVFISETGYISHKKKVSNISKNKKYNIDVSKVPAGKYLVTIVNGKTYTTPQKLIIL